MSPYVGPFYVGHFGGGSTCTWWPKGWKNQRVNSALDVPPARKGPLIEYTGSSYSPVCSCVQKRCLNPLQARMDFVSCSRAGRGML